jgi:radical SAM superfamily enzyme YgiQ (UPF0313 family)
MGREGRPFNKMKILLINSPTKEHPIVRDMAGGLGFDGRETIVLPPLELAYMAATLVKQNHEVKIIDADVENYTQKDVYFAVQDFKPDVIVASVSLPSLDDDCRFLNGLRKYSSGQIIAKTNIAYPPILEEILQKSSADVCIYGECDLNIEKILNGEEKIGSAYFKNDKLKVEENSVIVNLDELPLPARNLLPNEKYRYVLLGEKVTTMQTSRGCPYPCSYYCPYPLVQGSTWRGRSPEHALWEIEDIVNNYGIQKVLFRDATFTFDKERTHRICDLILEKNFSINWWCETRVDRLDAELMKKMKVAGCAGINIGVETGDPKLLETQAKIGLTLHKLKNVQKIARDLDIQLHFLLMIGLPKETRKSLYETYKLMCEFRPKTIGVCIVTPYPGTPIYEEAKQRGWIETEDWSRFGGHTPVMHTEFLTSDELSIAQRLISKGFFLFDRKLWMNRLRLRLLDIHFKRWADAKEEFNG